MSIELLSKEYGTPFYIFDVEKLRERVKYLQSYLPDVNLIYAVKANTFVIPYIHKYVSGLELCSFGEYEIAVKSNVPYEKMIISGVYKDYDSMEYMFSHELPYRFTVESLTQWYLLKEMVNKFKKELNVLLRLTSGSQFGMSEEDIRVILAEDNPNIHIKGIEYFSKTQRHPIPILEKELVKISRIMDSLEEEYQIEFEEFEYGPGFPVYYFQEEDFLEDAFLEGFREALKHIKNKKISLELGRSIAASMGEYVTKVVDMKTNHNGNYIIVDGGINHLVYYGGNMGINVPKHEIIPNRSGSNKYIICGSLCTINDIMVKEFRADNLMINDLIVFKNAGAYAPFEGISLFLSRELPKVLIKDKDKIEVVRDSVKTSELNSNYKKEVVL